MSSTLYWSSALAASIVLVVLPGCSRQDAEPIGKQQRQAEQAGGVSGPETIADLQLNSAVDSALREHADWDAEDHIQEANALTRVSKFTQSAAHCLAALRLQPKNLFAGYQLACTLSLWGHERAALNALRQVVQEGFWGYEMMRDDSDLERIMQAPEFPALLEEVQRRYKVESPKRIAVRHIRVPKGQAPPKGWPVLVFLHGYGDSGDSYVGFAMAAAENGFAGVAVSGPLVHWDRRYAWPKDRFATTHEYLRGILGRNDSRKDLDHSRVFLCGFSQGALHAVGLVASYPEEYAGVVALSPGGDQPPLPKEVGPSRTPRPLYLIVGQHEHPVTNLGVQQCADLWRRAGWPLFQDTHPGQHHFPRDWNERFPRILSWLVKNDASRK